MAGERSQARSRKRHRFGAFLPLLVVASFAATGPIGSAAAAGNGAASPATPAACTNTASITLGDPASSGSITDGAQVDCYTFDGTTGDKVHITVTGTSGTLEANTSVTDPSDATVCGPTTDSEQTCELATSGTHTIVISDATSSNTGDYTVAAELLPPPPPSCTPITLGSPAVAGSIATAGETDCYTFSGNLGDHVVVSVAETDGSLEAQTTILDPSAAALCGPTTDTDLSCHLTADGTYTISITDSLGTETGGYTVSAARVPVTCAEIVPPKFVFGTLVSGSVSAADEAHCYVFRAVTHDRIRIDSAATDGTLNLSVTLLRPNGSTVCTLSGTDQQTCTIPAKGVYKLFVRDLIGTGTGGYNLYVNRLGKSLGCSEITFGELQSGSISAPADTNCFTFRAKGQRIRIRVVETSGNLEASTEVVSSSGGTGCGATTATEETCRMVTGGTSTIFVRDAAGVKTGTYNIYVQISRARACGHVNFGKTAQSGAITVAGNADCYRFTGTNGHHLRIIVVATSGTLVPNTEVIAPNGSSPCGTTTATEQACRLTSTGKHIVFIRDLDGPNLGTYNVYIQDLDAPQGCTALTLGAPATAGSISVVGDGDCFTFAGVVAQSVHVQVIGTSGNLVPNTEVFKPTGVTLCGPSTATDQTCKLTQTGDHTVLIRDLSASGTGTYTVAVS